MLKTRVLPTLLFKEVGLVKGKNFRSDRRVGAALQAIRLYNRRGVDELIFLDISATHSNRPPDFAMIDQLADDCFMPLTVGGGVTTVDHVAELLAVGADKVSINSGAVNNPGLIAEASSLFGVQCIVVSIDVRRHGDQWRVYTHCGTRSTDLNPVDWAQEVERLGAGELLLTSIDRDGTMSGYEIEITRKVSDAVSIPVIASGGAGQYSHMVEAIYQGGASAVAAASMFHFTEQTPREAKLFLKQHGIQVRV